MDGVSVFSDHICELGEGPSYDPATDTLFWFDIVNGKLLEKPLVGALKVHDLGLMASAIAVIDDARQLIATEKGLYIRDVATGRLTLHTPIEADNQLTRSNDSRVHPCGAFWTGTMGKDEDKGAGSIYWFFKGELRRLFSDITVSNSICFSEDGAIAYYTDRLGFSLAFTYGDPPFYAQVARGGVRLNLRVSDGPIGFRAEETDELSATLTVDDAKALFLEFQQAGASFHQPLRTEPWGARTFIAADPDGNLLCFAAKG